MKKKERESNSVYHSWKLLEEHYQKISKMHLRQLFADDSRRGEKMVIEEAGIYFDYSKHRVTEETIQLLLQLAEEAGLPDYI
ncbi:MAG: hypothetical protein AB7V60_05210, partial [Candidatus Caldatribacteriota bacterium]